MKAKEEVLESAVNDYFSKMPTMEAWLKSRFTGVWNNGFHHGKEAVKRKCGTWIRDNDDIPICSECEEPALQRISYDLKHDVWNTKMVLSNYCPNCGAKMEVN